jgi:hypothetical protein
VERWIIDGRKLSLSEAAFVLAPALRPDNLEGFGGLLFQALVHEDAFHFGALPWFRGGQRSRHYDIRLPGPEARHLIGTLSADGTLMLVFKNPDVNDDDRAAYRLTIGLLARLFAAARPDGRWPLDTVTPSLFVEAGLWDPSPLSLEDTLRDE